MKTKKMSITLNEYCLYEIFRFLTPLEWIQVSKGKSYLFYTTFNHLILFSNWNVPSSFPSLQRCHFLTSLVCLPDWHEESQTFLSTAITTRKKRNDKQMIQNEQKIIKLKIKNKKFCFTFSLSSDFSVHLFFYLFIYQFFEL